MNEKELIDLLEKYFEEKDKSCIIKREAPFGSSRFDMFILSGETLIGVEIKGDQDSFGRLRTQLLDYIYTCDYVYIATNEKHLPTSVPPFIGWLAVRNGKIVELKKPTKIPDRNMEFLSLDSIAETLKISKLPISWNRYVRELFTVTSDLHRTLFLNYCFRNLGKEYKVKPIKNSVMLKLYLSNVKHDIEDAWSEAKQDYEIKSDLERDINSLDDDFGKIKRKLKRYTAKVTENKELCKPRQRGKK